MWQVETYPSGSMVVVSTTPGEPWLSVHGPKQVTAEDRDATHNRYNMCLDIAKFLSGGPRPTWLDDMERLTETWLTGTDGSEISAMGPTTGDKTDQKGWKYREDQQSADMRARLIDRLWLKPKV